MGMSISWVCVRGKTVEQVLTLLREERERLTWDNVFASTMRMVDMQNGSKIWEISHDSQIAFDHLDSDGALPDCFDEIRAAAVEKMKTRHRSLFGIPVDVCGAITGYHQSLHPLKTVCVPIPFL
ncbi:hypothetical protein KA344_13985 [bacterium]|nr:hypothetical protein [bacterium]